MGKNIIEDIKLVDNGTEQTDHFEIANSFAQFFKNKVDELNRNSKCEDYEVPDLNGWVSEDMLFNEIETGEALLKLKPSKAMGLDEIPGLVVKDLKNVILKPLCWLFNNIMITGIIPKAWKVSKIIPIHKKGAKELVSNYRPVSNISSLSKIFERGIINKLKLKSDDELFGTHQHAFRQGSSTVTAGLTFQDFIAGELDQKKLVLAYSADLTAAFDVLRPNLLVKNLLSLSVNRALVRIIFNFLCDRSAFVQIGNKTSYNWTLPIGCVQGSVLGPVLFNIYMRDLSQLVTSIEKDSFAMAYADDSYIALSCDKININNAIVSLTNIFNKHKIWLDKLGMICNPSKTEFIVFGNPEGAQKVRINFGNTMLESMKAMKVLGIMFDANLTWKEQTNKILSKCSSVSYSIRLLNRILPRNLHRQVIYSHFVSHLMYGSPIWAGCVAKKEIGKLASSLNKTLRQHCFDFHRSKSNSELYHQSRIRSLKSQILIQDAKFLYRLVTQCNNFNLVQRLTSQSIFTARFPNRISFFDQGRTRIARNSFINRARSINEAIPFDWLDLQPIPFEIRLKRTIPIDLQ